MLIGGLELPRWPAIIAIGVLAVLLGVLAVVQPVAALGLSIGLAFVTVMIGDVMVGLALFAFVAFLEVPAPGVGSVAKAAGLALLGSWIAWVVTRRDSRPDFFKSYPIASYAILLFLAWTAASALWAKDSGEALASVMRFAPNMLLLPIAVTALRDRRGALAIFSLFILGGLASMLIGLLLGPGATGGGALNAEPGRLVGAGVDSNELAMTLAGCTVLAAALAGMKSIAPFGRVVAAGAAALCVLGVLLTASRTGIVGLGAAIFLGTIFAGRGRRAPLIVLGVLGVISIGGYLVAIAPEAALKRITQPDADGGSGREDIWAVGWRMVEANPLQGVGAGNYANTSADYLLRPGYITDDTFILANPKVAHNIYLQVLAELGIIGLSLFVAIAGFALVCALKAAWLFSGRGDPTLEVVSRAVFVAGTSMLIASFFVSQQFNKPLWVLLALGPALLALARHGDPRAPAPASGPRAHLPVGARV